MARKTSQPLKKSNKITALPVVLMLLVALLLVLFIAYSKPKEAIFSPQDYLSYTPPQDSDGAMLNPCTGNTTNQCINAPSIDLYPGGSEDAYNPYLIATGDYKEIMGRVTQQNRTTITIKTTNDELFTFGFPTDVINDFNTRRSSFYDGIKIGTDTMIYVAYYQTATNTDDVIQPSQIQKSSIILKNKNFKTDSSIELY